MTDNENQKNEAVMHAFSNDKSPENIQLMTGLLKVIYHLVLKNKVGIMHVKDKDNNVKMALVAMEPNKEGGSDCYPLTLLLTEEEALTYAAPDGKGGWIVPSVETTEPEVKE